MKHHTDDPEEFSPLRLTSQSICAGNAYSPRYEVTRSSEQFDNFSKLLCIDVSLLVEWQHCICTCRSVELLQRLLHFGQRVVPTDTLRAVWCICLWQASSSMLLALKVHQHFKSFVVLTATSATPLLIDAVVVSFSLSLSKKEAFFFSNKSAALFASFFKLLACENFIKIIKFYLNY